MELFLGKWEAITSESEGLEEYFDRNNMSAEERQIWKNVAWTQSFHKDGEQYFSETAIGDLKEGFKFKLGQEVSYQNYRGEPVVATFNLKDGKVIGTGTEGRKPISTCDYIVGGKLRINITCSGATAKFVLRKV